MAENVVISFQSTGISEVTRAFESVEKAIVRLQKASERESAKLARDQVRQANQAGKEREKVLIQELKNRNRLEIEAAKNATRLSIEGAKAFERAEREKTRIFQQQERERARAAMQSAREVSRSSGGPGFRQVVGGGITKGLGSLASGAAKVGGLALAAGGGLAISDMLSYETAGQRKAAQVSNQIAQFSKQRVGTDAIQRLARGAQASSGVKANDLLGGFSEYLAASSDFDPKDTGKSQELMAFLGKVSQATGSDVTDIFRTAGTLKSQNKNMTDDQLKNMFLAVVSQGSEGAVELKDLAKYSEKITSSSAQYQGDQSANQRKLLGLAQLVKPISPTGEIGSSIEHFASDAQSAPHRKKIAAALGRDLYNEAGQIKSPEELLLRGMNYAKGDVSKLQALGFGERGIDVFRAMGGTYNEAAGATKGTAAEKHAAAMAAVRAKVERQLGAAGYSQSDLEKDVATSRSTRGAKTEEAFQQLRDKIADGLLPVIDKWVDKLPQILPVVEKIIERFGAFASWVADNPVKAGLLGLGAAISKEILAQLATAQLGKLLGGAAGGIGGGGGAMQVGSLVVGAATIAAASFAAYELGKGAIDAASAGAVKGQQEAYSLTAATVNAQTPEELAMVRERGAAMKDKAREASGANDIFSASGLAKLGIEGATFLPRLAIDAANTAVTGDKGGVFTEKSATDQLSEKVEALKFLQGTAQFAKDLEDASERLKKIGAGEGSRSKPLSSSDN